MEPLLEEESELSLAPCPFDVADITFIEFLGSSTIDNADGTPPHSRVFKVKIGETNYALKIFKFASIEDLRPWVGENARLARLLTDKYLRLHEDPFFRECRAFGRLNKVDKKVVRVVHCYGWLYLDKAVEQMISEKFDIYEWDRQPEHENQPLRAVLKDWLRFHTPFNRRTFKDMRRDLFNLNHKLYIFNLDIRKDNYVGGWLFDFSSSRTVPHIFFIPGVRRRSRNRMDMETDDAYFEEMVEEFEAEQKARAKEMEERWANLRRRKIAAEEKTPSSATAASKKRPPRKRRKGRARN